MNDPDDALEIYKSTTARIYPTMRNRDMMTFEEFSKNNLQRCESKNGFNHSINSWSLSDWFTALTGELGEAANIAKKLNRLRDGVTGNSETETESVLRSNLADEIADVFIYLDLLAQSQDIELGEAIQSKFERTSAKIGYDPTDPQ